MDSFVDDLDDGQTSWLDGHYDEDNDVASDIDAGLNLYLNEIEQDDGLEASGRSKRFTMEFNGMQGT